MKYASGNCVYIISYAELINLGIYKIGFTKDVNKRLKPYRTFSPSEPKVLYICYVDDMRKTESMVKNLLSNKKYKPTEGGTEWYYTDDISEFVSAIIKCKNIVVKSTVREGFISRFISWIFNTLKSYIDSVSSKETELST
jgi:flavorubredoxin